MNFTFGVLFRNRFGCVTEQIQQSLAKHALVGVDLERLLADILSFWIWRTGGPRSHEQLDFARVVEGLQLAGAFFDQFDERDFLQLKRLWASEIQKRGDHL